MGIEKIEEKLSKIIDEFNIDIKNFEIWNQNNFPTEYFDYFDKNNEKKIIAYYFVIKNFINILSEIQSKKRIPNQKMEYLEKSVLNAEIMTKKIRIANELYILLEDIEKEIQDYSSKLSNFANRTLAKYRLELVNQVKLSDIDLTLIQKQIMNFEEKIKKTKAKEISDSNKIKQQSVSTSESNSETELDYSKLLDEIDNAFLSIDYDEILTKKLNEAKVNKKSIVICNDIPEIHCRAFLDKEGNENLRYNISSGIIIIAEENLAQNK